jgi:hypothetical protein
MDRNETNEQEFKVRRRDRMLVSLAASARSLIGCVGRTFPALRRLLLRRFQELFERYARLAYLADQGDVGLFETFILEKGKVDTIISNYEKRNSTWKRNELIERMQGLNRPEDFERCNMQHSLVEKKTEVLKMITAEGRLIEFFGKRIARFDPVFYRGLAAVHDKLTKI